MPDRLLRVLILEDNEDDALLMERALRSYGHRLFAERVETRSGFAEALGRFAWDVVLADCNLPGFNTQEALKLLRAKGSDAPFLIVSGTVGEEAAAALMKGGANDYVLKANLARLGPAVQRELRDAGVRASHRAAQEQLRQLAYFDPATGLPNGNLLDVQITRALARANPRVAVLSVELHRLADIRHTLGPRQVDVFLRLVAARFSLAVGTPTVLAHPSPGTFAVLALGADQARAEEIARGLLDSLQTPISDGALRVRFGAVIGIVLAPDHGSTADTLHRRASVAAELARRSGQQFAFYDPTGDVYNARRLDMITDLWHAPERDELELVYLPKIDLRNRSIVSFEALLRWRRPHHGYLTAEEFIPLAEQSGSIRPISAWVARKAIAQCAAWRAAGLNIGVAMNLSPSALHDPSTTALIAGELSKNNLWPSVLEVEFTEGALMADPAAARATLCALCELGVQCVIDDFGAGYSSLAYLKTVPLRALKIDRSFMGGDLADPRDDSIVRSTIGLAHHLGLEVVAEGVEGGAGLERLVSYGCDFAQGYYIARPMATEDVPDWIRESGWSVAE
jgi:predicted signal transduction protein with EAL and GGDEF domain